MSLYEGLDLSSEKDQSGKKEVAVGWSSGIKLLQSQLQLKKAALTQTKRDQLRKGSTLPPVVDLGKARKEEEQEDPQNIVQGVVATTTAPVASTPVQTPIKDRENQSPNSTVSAAPFFSGDPDWSVKDEYDPMWPSDYEKITKERREKKEKERDEDRRRDYEERRRKSERHRDETREKRKKVDEDEGKQRKSSTAGAAIAPPPSLVGGDDARRDLSAAGYSSGLGSSVAAKIMAKYGFREGQGLGKQQQGMSQALQVEKTSKRGGKIIHERDVPKVAEPLPPPLPPPPPPPPPPLFVPGNSQTAQTTDLTASLTEAMKNPSKVVLLRNMVGPGEVDEDLEPETKEECTKYGDVHRCKIFETPDTNEEEAVKIFVEFKRIESAIKAVVDLNGRYFGGRIVKAGFYDVDKFHQMALDD